ncbi:MAG: ABC transporter ATP-binding protein [Termitinemataceae bacterium]|nr:MAG: ABC transporter ATP-binding protein [Termitinemataceae bacterium]
MQASCNSGQQNEVPFISMKGVFKTFRSNGANALDYADFDLRRGEIHALFGENGAGKSTLMHILCGFIKDWEGSLFVDGIERKFSHTNDALQNGIGMVRQKPSLVPGFKVWEDASLNYGGKLFFYKHNAKQQIRNLCKKFDLDLSLDAKTETLSTSMCLFAATLSLLMCNLKCIIFDEPTSILNESETKKFISLCKQLKQNGCTVVIISHKLEETLNIADRITILCKGRTAATKNSNECTKEELLKLIFQDKGTTKINGANNILHPSDKISEKKILLDIKNICVEQSGYPILANLNLKLRSGIYCVAGVKESGSLTLELTISGFLKPKSGSIDCPSGNGSYLCNGTTTINGKSIKAYENDLSIQDNLLIHSYTNDVDKIIAKSGLTNKANQKMKTLSGGMLQRLLLFREFETQNDFFVLRDPAMGLDARKRKIIFDAIKNRSDRGAAFLLFISDIDDIFEIGDEVIVLSGGRITLQLPLANANKNEVLQRIRAAMVC